MFVQTSPQWFRSLDYINKRLVVSMNEIVSSALRSCDRDGTTSGLIECLLRHERVVSLTGKLLSRSFVSNICQGHEKVCLG